MAKYVEEIMNHELFSVAPEELAGDVRGYFRTLGIAAAPVVDDEGRPIGFVSLRDVAGVQADCAIASIMSAPADPILRTEAVVKAAQTMAERDRHHLVVVNEEGRSVGFVGSLDIVRALVGAPVPHPTSFPHYDVVADVTWTDDYPLISGNVEHAPDGPGLLRLVRSTAGVPDRVVWSQATHNVRTRVLDLLSGPQPAMGHLADELERGTLRFRAAATTVER